MSTSSDQLIVPRVEGWWSEGQVTFRCSDEQVGLLTPEAEMISRRAYEIMTGGKGEDRLGVSIEDTMEDEEKGTLIVDLKMLPYSLSFLPVIAAGEVSEEIPGAKKLTDGFRGLLPKGAAIFTNPWGWSESPSGGRPQVCSAVITADGKIVYLHRRPKGIAKAVGLWHAAIVRGVDPEKHRDPSGNLSFFQTVIDGGQRELGITEDDFKSLHLACIGQDMSRLGEPTFAFVAEIHLTFDKLKRAWLEGAPEREADDMIGVGKMVLNGALANYLSQGILL